MDINTFLDDISRQIEDATSKIIKDNQGKFESLVLSNLKKGISYMWQMGHPAYLEVNRHRMI